MSHKQKEISVHMFTQLSDNGDYVWRSLQHLRRHLRCQVRKYYKYNGYPPDGKLVDVEWLIHMMHNRILR